MTKKFNNRENKLINYEGVDIWLSRSVAVVGLHFVESNGEMYVLIEKRSNKMDCPGKWSAACGYLDWDESAYEAVIRETYEETGFYVPDQKELVWKNEGEPIKVNSAPTKDARQNVSLIYLFVYKYENGLPKEPISFTSSEVDEVIWLNINNLDSGFFSDPGVWAFNHDSVIGNAVGFYNKTFH
jgi:8-oxo-dGTP pyrophosphatase MutT (NUDIX family)